jgi:hypothetical protein
MPGSPSVSRPRLTEKVLKETPIEALIARWTGGSGFERQTIRQYLVALGRPAVGPLTSALLRASDNTVRWEAAKTLREIADPASAPALVCALEDRMFSVRWLAAGGLIAMERAGLPDLLRVLIERPNSLRLLQGAHHVLRVLVEGGIADEAAPVLEALRDVEPEVGVPVAAFAALKSMADTCEGGKDA